MTRNQLIKVLLGFGLIFCWVAPVTGQTCPSLLSPISGSVDVPVEQTISWEPVAEIPGYRIILGTTPGGSELLEQSVGSATSYTPPMGLPANTQIYVTIVLDYLFEVGDDIFCTGQSFRTEAVTSPPSCISLDFPSDGSTNVSIFSSLHWLYAISATGYNLSVGTSPGATNIFSGDVGNVLSFNPPGNFPPTTTIYVELQPYNTIGSAVGPCTAISFTTGIAQTLPGCTSMISPANGSSNVPLTPLLEWAPVPNADGYRLTIGDTPFNANILDNVSFTTNSTFVINFLANKVFFIKIVPYNSAGEAIGCAQESFSTLLGCGPYFDPTLGDFVDYNPEIDIPDIISFCQNESPFVITTDDTADGYRWYRVFDFAADELISDTNEVSLVEEGSYRYEAFNYINQLGTTVECLSFQEFDVVSSEPARVDGLIALDGATGLDLTVLVSGIGDYEFTINDRDGPYQDSNNFTSLPIASYIIYIRDKNGCGIVEERFSPDIRSEGFPPFFTPNGDGINDYWQFVPPLGVTKINLNDIMIFDRIGNLLAQIDPLSQGWDGTFNGRPLPATTYWFKATVGDKKPLVGFFTLKR